MIYRYSIASDFPGGTFNSDISNRLQTLIVERIETPLVGGVNSDGEGSVLLDFESELPPDQKTILDGDKTNPAGGLIAESCEYFSVVATGPNGPVEIMSGSVFPLESNGVFSARIDLQYRDGNGDPMNGRGEIDIDTVGLAPVSAAGGQFDGSGQWTFTVEPTTLRGKVPITLASGSLPAVSFVVELT